MAMLNIQMVSFSLWKNWGPKIWVPIRRATQKSDSSRFRVSGFGFRVSSIETNFRCRFRVSGFGFRRLKPTFAVGFGFRVSGFGFRSVLWKVSPQSRFRVSGFGFRVSQFETNFNSPFRVSGFGFRVSLVETNSADLSPDHVSKILRQNWQKLTLTVGNPSRQEQILLRKPQSIWPLAPTKADSSCSSV